MEENIETAVTGVNAINAPAPKAPKNKGLIAAVIIFAILAVAGIGFGIFMFISTGGFPDDVAVSCSEKFDQDSITITDTVGEGANDVEVKEVAVSLRNALNEAFNTSLFNGTFGEFAIVKSPSTEVYTISTDSYGVPAGTANGQRLSDIEQDIMNRGYDVALSHLKTNGFVETAFSDPWGEAVIANYDKGIYCTVSEQQIPFYASCAKDTWYDYDAVDKDLAVTLAKVSGLDFISGAKSENIKDSQVAPYQIIEAGGGNFAALFYRVSPDSDWQYFRGAQSIIGCEYYDTQDIKNAFAGELCTELDGTTSTVQP